MHTVVIKRSVYQENPWVARAIMDAFEKAKQAAQNIYRAGSTFFTPALMIPWAASLQERNRRLMGDDFWPYGIERNRKTLETCLRYNREQHLLSRELEARRALRAGDAGIRRDTEAKTTASHPTRPSKP